MAERSLVDYVLRGMKGRWAWPVKHADGFTEGVADVSGWIKPAGTVWIELKALDKWPVRATTPVRLALEELQKEFLWHRRGWLLARVKREYFLFDRFAVRNDVETEHCTQEAFRKAAKYSWRNSIDWQQFERAIKRRQYV